jgi:hypothetical protein
MRRNGKKVGELGPFRTRALAARQAQPFADQAASGVIVTVEPARVRKRVRKPSRYPGTPPRRRNSKKSGAKSQSIYARAGRKIKKGALMTVAPRPIRRAMLAFGFALMDPKISAGSKFLAMGGAAPVALADGPAPGPADLAALGLTVAQARAIVKARHIAKADRLLESA